MKYSIIIPVYNSEKNYWNFNRTDSQIFFQIVLMNTK